MKYFFFILLLIPLLVIANPTQDSISRLDMENLKLHKEIQSLKENLRNTELHIKEIQEERKTQYELRYEKLDSRLTNSIWTISILIAVIAALITLVGWNLLRKSVKKYFNKQAKALTTQKINTILTEDWIREEVKEKAEIPINEAIENLKQNFIVLSRKVLDEEKAIMIQYHDEAEKAVERIKEREEELKKRREDLEKSGIAKKTDKLNEEEKQKVLEYEEALESAKKEEDYTADDWFWKGKAEYEEGNIREAVELMNKSLELDDTNDNTWVWLGFLKSFYNNEEATIASKKAIKINPNNAEAWLNLGYLKLKIKEYRKGVKDLKKSIKLNPDNYKAYNNVGAAYNYLKEYEKAIKYLNIAIDLFPQYDKAFAHRAFSHIMLNKMEQANSDNNKSINITPDYNRPYYNLGLIKQKEGKNKEACKAWKKALELGFEEAQEKLDEFCVKD